MRGGRGGGGGIIDVCELCVHMRIRDMRSPYAIFFSCVCVVWVLLTCRYPDIYISLDV